MLCAKSGQRNNGLAHVVNKRKLNGPLSFSLAAWVTAIFLALETGCEFAGSDSLLPKGWEDIIRTEWAITQRTLSCLGYTKAASIPPERFTWRVRSKLIQCGGQLASGCYSQGDKLIQFWESAPTVIHHEAGHAILDVLPVGPKWRCYEHPEYSWCPAALTNPGQCTNN